MLTKGIIESKVQNSNLYNVYVPYFNNPNSTKRTLLEATLSYTPGITYNYELGDVVWVLFEDHQACNPVIIGKLFVEEDKNLQGDKKWRGTIETSSVNIKDAVYLPREVHITDNKSTLTLTEYVQNMIESTLKGFDSYNANKKQKLIHDNDGKLLWVDDEDNEN